MQQENYLIFLVYINEINRAVRKLLASLFADDILVSIAVNDYDGIINNTLYEELSVHG